LFQIDTPDLDRLDKMLALIPILTAPWLTSGAFAVTSDTEHVYEPTHVKQLRTTAPKDIKAVKEQRAQGKAAAKLRREVKGIISKKSRNRSRFQLGT
jgi:ribonuclease P/MRP protein subunit POP3